MNRFDLNSAAKRIEKKMKKMKVKMIRPRGSAIVEEEKDLLKKELKRHLKKWVRKSRN